MLCSSSPGPNQVCHPRPQNSTPGSTQRRQANRQFGWLAEDAHHVLAELRRLAPQLRLHGLCITFERRCDGRFVTLTWESVPINQSTCATADSEKS